MPYTLKLKKSSHPLFIQDDGKTVDSKPTDNVVSFESLNDLAVALHNKDIVISETIKFNTYIVELDFSKIAKNNFIENPHKDQDNNHPVRIFDFNFIDFIVSRRLTKLYTTTKNIEIQDPLIDKLEIIQVPNEDAKFFKVNQDVLFFYNYKGNINSFSFHVFDIANSDKLFENRDINTTDNQFFIVYKNDTNFKL